MFLPLSQNAKEKSLSVIAKRQTDEKSSGRLRPPLSLPYDFFADGSGHAVLRQILLQHGRVVHRDRAAVVYIRRYLPHPVYYFQLGAMALHGCDVVDIDRAAAVRVSQQYSRSAKGIPLAAAKPWA